MCICHAAQATIYLHLMMARKRQHDICDKNKKRTRFTGDKRKKKSRRTYRKGKKKKFFCKSGNRIEIILTTMTIFFEVILELNEMKKSKNRAAIRHLTSVEIDSLDRIFFIFFSSVYKKHMFVIWLLKTVSRALAVTDYMVWPTCTTYTQDSSTSH